jgi:ribosomal protein L40E
MVFDLEDSGINIGITICSNCGDFILKHFKVCPTCNAEVGSPVIKNEIPSPENTSMDPSMFVCLNCGAFIGVDATHCKACGAKRAPLTAEIDISKGKARNSDAFLETTSEISFCPGCGALLSSSAERCSECGEDVLEKAADKHQSKFKAVRDLLETKKDEICICTNCGAFTSPGSTKCGICGESTNNVKKPFSTQGTPPKSSDKKLSSSGVIFLCEECGAFLGNNARECRICGTQVKGSVKPLAESELINESHFDKASEKVIPEVPEKNVKESNQAGRKIAHMEPKRTKAEVIKNLKRLWYKKAIALKKLGKYKEALSSLNKALSQDHDDKDLILAKADIYYELQRYKQAARLYKRLIESEPKSVVLWNRLGNTLLRMGNPEESLMFYEKALSIESNNVEAMVNKGYILMKQKKFDEALKCAEKINA